MVEHKHKVEVVVDVMAVGDLRVYWIEMDCPVNPEKVVVTNERINMEDDASFDPHFSNEIVLARFPATEDGWRDACSYASVKERFL